MLILPSQLSSCRADPIKSEDGKSIDLNSGLVKNRTTPRKRKGPQVSAYGPNVQGFFKDAVGLLDWMVVE
jgi:hypothetical protein